jgi:hypothetical protein
MWIILMHKRPQPAAQIHNYFPSEPNGLLQADLRRWRAWAAVTAAAMTGPPMAGGLAGGIGAETATGIHRRT